MGLVYQLYSWIIKDHLMDKSKTIVSFVKYKRKGRKKQGKNKTIFDFI